MITTVFASGTEDRARWGADLLAASWRRAAQSGALFRLTAAGQGIELPLAQHAQPVATLPFDPHPYTGDASSAYLLPAGLLEWLFRERFEGTVLVLETSSVFRAPIAEEVTPGRVIATPWPDLPRPGSGPFGLGDELAFLGRVCADHALEVPAVTLPALVHSRDLLRLAPRWLELTMLLREECREWTGWSHSTHRLAFALALAEWQLEVDSRPLAVGAHEPLSDERCEAQILTFHEPIRGGDGQVIWDPASWQPKSAVDPEAVEPGPGRELLTLVAEMIAFDAAGGELSLIRPRRREGVREARVLDQMILDVPGQEGTVSLNPSSASIWELVDGDRTAADIARHLEQQFDKARGELDDDVETAIEHLREAGALDLVPVAP